MTTFFTDSAVALERLKAAKERHDEMRDRRMAASGIEALVCDDITRRQAHGIAKYGTTVADNPLTQRQWLQHAYEEALDLSVYLRRAMDEMDRAK